MLHRVPEKLKNISRVLVLRHPNNVDIAVFRKVNTREDGDGDDDIYTIGGVAVLSSEDNAYYEIEHVGDGKMLFLERHQGAEYNSDQTGLVYPEEWPKVYIEPNELGAWEAKKHDRVFIILPDFTMEYQIKAVDSKINIPPYTKTYYLQPLEHSPNGMEMP